MSLSYGELLYGYVYLDIDIDENVFKDSDTKEFIRSMKRMPKGSLDNCEFFGDIAPRVISKDAFLDNYNNMIYNPLVNERVMELQTALLRHDWNCLTDKFPETCSLAYKPNSSKNPKDLILDEYTFFSFFPEWDKGFKGLRNDDFIVFYAPPKQGKKCADSTPVLTTQGWKRHEDLQIGDYVYGRYGKPVKVLNIFNDIEDLDCDYEVEFTDGEVIKVHGDHEWTVLVDRHVEKTLETNQMFNSHFLYGIRGKRGSRCKYQVDANTLIEFPTQKLPIHPYLLGLWLGDGYTAKPDIAHSSKDIESIEKVIRLDYERTHLNIHPSTGVCTSGFWGDTYQNFKSLDLGHKKGRSKYIPDVYKFSDKSQRLELLAGIIDSDGCVSQKTGRVVISNTNRELIYDIKELCVSLGFRVCISEVEPKISSSGITGRQSVYQLSFNPDVYIPTALPRKKITKLIQRKKKRGIIDIRKCTPERGKCIQVEGGIYLVGKSLIPTHNSTVTAYLAFKAIESGIPIGFYPTELSISVTLKYILGFALGLRGNEALAYFDGYIDQNGQFVEGHKKEFNELIEEYNHLIHLPPTNIFNYNDYESLYLSDAQFIFHDNFVRSLSQLGLNEDASSASQFSRRLSTIQQKYTKCFGRGTKIRLADGSIKPVEAVVEEDYVMGRDSMPRKVIGTCSGVDDLYKITPFSGKPYIVNSKHDLILTKSINNRNSYTKEVTISAEDYYKYSQTVVRDRRYQSIKEGIKYSYRDLEVDPYILGVWLGDGTSKETSITSMDKEIIKAWVEYGESLNLRCSNKTPSVKASCYNLVNCKGKSNILRDKLRSLGVFGNKHIPLNYLRSSRSQRLALLAGLIDTDGCYINKGSGRYNLTMKDTKLVDDIEELLISLGFDCRRYSNSNNDVVTFIIRGDFTQCPIKVPRKQYNKSFKYMNPIKIEKLDRSEFYGFQLEGDPEFLLADGTVVHNCTFLVTQEAMRECTPKEQETNPGVLEVGKGYTAISRSLLQECSLAFNVRAKANSATKELIVKNDRFRGLMDLDTQMFASISNRGKLVVNTISDSMTKSLDRLNASLEKELL